MPQSHNRKLSINLKFCSINIAGMSSRSRFMLDKYADTNQFDAMAVQESGTTEHEKLAVTNMQTITDDNCAKNKGSVLYMKNLYSLTKLKELNQISKNIDTSWGITVIDNKRLIIGSIYLKLHYLDGIQEMITMLNKANDIKLKLKATGVILIGDLNARHTSWGDSMNNAYGNKLVELLDISKFSICSADSPTFLATNGSSSIDLMIVSNNLVEKVQSCTTDKEAELYSGAPFRGHVPVIATFDLDISSKNKKATEKLNTDKICWDKWSQDLETSLEQAAIPPETLNDPHSLGQILDETIQTVTLKHGVKKISSSHSKPYWTAELTRLCNEMRHARWKYCKRNTDANKDALNTTKEAFDNARKKECQDFLIQKASKLNSVQALRFWKEFNLIFKKKTEQKIDPLIDKEGNLLTEVKDLEELMFATFFEGHHLQDGNFDDHFYNETNRLYEVITNNQQARDENLEDYGDINAEITTTEIKAAIKSYQTSGKSSDKENFNPVMFKHLGCKAIDYIRKLANLCLKEGKWIWDKAEVIFLKKNGKDTYSKPGSYRPISISSYIGKLIEKILTARIYKFLISLHLYDNNQEGFMPKRNTIRYLNRLINGVKSDIQKKLTAICLFIDFEKAFDSIWKAGLIVKLHKIGIRGNFLHLINDFLVNRKVTININGVVGIIRQSTDVGLPQGSALSPILFRIYLMDILEDLENNKAVKIFKFADDGSIKVTGTSTPECLENFQIVLNSVEDWVKKNRMIINCQPDKTEILCFSTAENDRSLVPETFKLCGQDIKLVKHTKALGLTIDEDLNFIEHGKTVYKKLANRWSTICRYSHRNWGFNYRVMIQIIKTLFHSSLFYAGFLWINKHSMEEINKLYYQIMKATIGSVFNIRHSLAEIILGIPPISILNTTNLIKHYLKIILNDSPGDKLKDFLTEELESETDMRSRSVVYHPIKQVMKFLNWKIKVYPESVSEIDKQKIETKNVEEFLHLDQNSCKYTKSMMDKYVEHMWKSSVQNEYLLEGHSVIPNPSARPLSIDRGTNREEEVLTLSFLYDNNLMNQFLYRHNRTLVTSPLCDCGNEEQTAHHLLFRCDLVDIHLRDQAFSAFQQAVGSDLATTDSTIALVNASRHPPFMNSIVEIVKSAKHRLRTHIEL